MNDDQLEKNNGELDHFEKIVSELIVKSEFIMNDANTRAVFSMQILTAILENLLPSARLAYNSSNLPIQAAINVREALNG